MLLTPGSLLREPRAPGAPARVWRDWALVAVLLLGAAVELLVRPDLPWPPVAVATTFVAVWSVLTRRTRPLLATAVAFLVLPTVSLVGAVTVGEPVGLFANVAVATVAYALTRWGSGREIAWGLVIIGYAWVVGTISDADGLGDVIGGLVALFLVVESGALVRFQERSRREAVSQARSLEREQIARELHDTVAHHVSAIAVQAQAGRTVAKTRPQAAAETLAVIEEAASRTLAEMRAMVGALRGGDRDQAVLSPQRGIADLPALADAFDAGAVSIHVTMDGPVRHVGPTLGAALFRLAQESVTNAVRHARDASTVDVRVSVADEHVRLTVTDDGAAAEQHPRRSGGYGLVGMGERVAALGGSLAAGPNPHGRGWRVEVVLPHQRARE